MHPFVKLLKELQTTNSVKDKEDILRKYQNDDYVLELLSKNLDPYRNFYIKKMPERLSHVKDSTLTIKSRYQFFTGLAEDLEHRHLTGNKAKEAVQAVFRIFPDDEYEVYKKVLLKEAIGIGATTVNKVIPNHIREFKVMLAPSKLPNLTELKYPLYVQPKYDGFRAIYKDGQFYTRSGLIYPNINLKKHFKCLEGLENYTFDGELYIHGQPFQDLSKVLNADEVTIPNGLKYHVYDCLPTKDWLAQSTKLSYVDRLKLLRSIVNDSIADYSKVIDAPTDLVEDASEVVEIYKKYLKSGYEGCMLKAVEGKYQWKRTTLKSGEMIKLKPFETLDLKVTGIFDGEGKYEGKAGGILVDYNGTAVRVGSGFDDALRETISKDPTSYIGKTAEIKYFEETEDKSLRFPIFIRWRDDK